MPDHKRHTNYECKECNYFTQKKSNWTRHINSKKHARIQGEKIKEEIKKKEMNEETIIDLKSQLYDLKKENKYLEEDNKQLEKENKRLYKEMMKYRKELNYRKAGLK
jgi:predicted RNase H-like nuclease (RuvC/YqgF family)